MTIRVFVDVDTQNDFCAHGGALLVPGSPNGRFAELTAYAVRMGIPIVGSVDSHAFDAWEFASSGNAGPSGEKPGFPDHCVKGTRGWLKVDGTLPPRFRFVPNAPGVAFLPYVEEMTIGRCQAAYFEKEVYSLFANPVAEEFLRALVDRLGHPTEFVVYGVATEYCVRAAVRGLAERGYHVALVTDAIAGIGASEAQAAIAEMAARGARRITTEEVMA